MEAPWLVPAALLFGVVVGIGATVVYVIAHARGQRAMEVVSPSMPEGVSAVIDALESVGIVLDPSNNVLTASASASSFGLVWGDALVHQELTDLVDQVRRDGQPVSTELHLRRGRIGDATLFLLVRVARLGTRYVLVLADDRTEAHRLDEMRRDFVGNISHELKTPIGAVGLLAEAIQSAAAEPDEVKRFAKRMTKEADRLAKITSEIIELSRLQARDPFETSELVDVDAVIQRAIDHNRVGADAKGIQLVTGKRVKADVLGDTELLVTAVNNLVSNAIRYSPEHTRVGIGVRRSDGIVEIAVTDQGIGIAENDRDRVFERFYRVDSARSRGTGGSGSGLGLAIVKHVVQNHGGDVRLWSQPEKGSTFTIRLPEAPGASAANRGESA